MQIKDGDNEGTQSRQQFYITEWDNEKAKEAESNGGRLTPIIEVAGEKKDSHGGDPTAKRDPSSLAAKKERMPSVLISPPAKLS